MINAPKINSFEIPEDCVPASPDAAVSALATGVGGGAEV